MIVSGGGGPIARDTLIRVYHTLFYSIELPFKITGSHWKAGK
jgi:hypothetical protein